MVNLDALVRYGTINERDVDLMVRTDSVDEAYDYLTRELIAHNLDQPGPVL